MAAVVLFCFFAATNTDGLTPSDRTLDSLYQWWLRAVSATSTCMVGSFLSFFLSFSQRVVFVLSFKRPALLCSARNASLIRRLTAALLRGQEAIRLADRGRVMRGEAAYQPLRGKLEDAGEDQHRRSD